MLDHILAVVFAVGFPLINAPIYARRRPLLRANDSATRQREYKETILWLGARGSGREKGTAVDRPFPDANRSCTAAQSSLLAIRPRRRGYFVGACA